MVSCNTQKVLRTFKSGFAWSHAIRSKGTGLQSPALSLLKSLPGFLSRQNYRALLRNDCDSLRLLARRFFANFLFACEAPRWRFSYRLSIRLRRMFLALLPSFIICLNTRPLIILCARTALIQRGQDAR